MKKLAAVLLTAVMAFSLCFCGETNESSDDKIKIGVMQFGEFTALTNSYDGFVAGLKEAGYEDGQNIEIKYLSAAADTANCPTIADTLINNGSDLIFAIATPSVSCIKEKTKTIPVIFTAVTDPVASGLIDSETVPDCNISGCSDMNPVAEQIEILLDVLPEAKKVAVLYCSSESNSAVQFEIAQNKLKLKGVECVEKTISAIDEAKSAIESLKGEVDAIYIPTDNVLSDGMSLVSSVADECGIPTFCGEPGMVENGGTFSYGINYFELGREAGRMAAHVLKANNPQETIASLPIYHQTEECTIAINKKSAEKCHLTFPEDILEEATVIE